MRPSNASLFQPDRFAHANLFVGELQRSLSFYHQVCGLEKVFAEPGVGAGFLSNGATHHDIGLMQVSDKPLIGKDGTVQNSMERGRRPGLNHIAFHVVSEASLVDAYRHADAHGVRLEKALDHGMSRSLYLYDPDGNAVEFYIDIVADWRGFYAENRDALITSTWRPDPATLAPAFAPPPRVQSRVPGAPFHTLEVCGATLAVCDLAASADFYTSVGGLSVLARGGRGVLLGLPGQDTSCLALVATDADTPAGLRSLWFLAEPDSPALGPAVLPGMRLVGAGAGARAVTRDPDGLDLVFHGGASALPRSAEPADLLTAPETGDARPLH